MKTPPLSRIVVMFALAGGASMIAFAETNNLPSAVLSLPKTNSIGRLDPTFQLNVGGTNPPIFAAGGTPTTKYSMRMVKPNQDTNYCLRVVRPAAGTHYAIQILR